MKVLFLFLLWSPFGSVMPKKAAAAANDGDEVAGVGGAGMGLVDMDAELAIWWVQVEI